MAYEPTGLKFNVGDVPLFDRKLATPQAGSHRHNFVRHEATEGLMRCQTCGWIAPEHTVPVSQIVGYRGARLIVKDRATGQERPLALSQHCAMTDLEMALVAAAAHALEASLGAARAQKYRELYDLIDRIADARVLAFAKGALLAGGPKGLDDIGTADAVVEHIRNTLAQWAALEKEPA